MKLCHFGRCRLCVVIILPALLFVFMAGCGSRMTLTTNVNPIQTAPGIIESFGTLSGFTYSTAGAHYKATQSLGSPLAEDVQTSVDGRYQVK